MSILFMAGSLRADSANKKFAREAQRLAAGLGLAGEFVDLKQYPMPVYDGDIEAGSGIPETTQKLGEKIRAAHALVISLPEYNGSMPGMFKNVIDWLSREKNMSLAGKHVLLLAASPGALGGIRVLWHARQPLEVLGMHVYSGMLGLPGAYNAFDPNGQLKDADMAEKLKKLLQQFAGHAGVQKATAGI